MTTPPALVIAGLTHRHGDRLALDDVSLTVAPGSVHGLLGPNGAGKTTLLRATLGLLTPDTGSVALLGERAEPGAGLPAGVAGFVEIPRFWASMTGERTLTALARLDAPHSAADTAVGELLERLDLTGAAATPVGHYSLGMRQRLAVASALLRAPRLLVLDEPTGGLDPAGLRLLESTIRDLAAAGCAVLLSSHDLVEVGGLCDEVTVLRTGQVVFQGSMARARAAAPAASYVVHTTDDIKARAALADVGLEATPVTDGLRLAGGDLVVDAAVERLVGADLPLRGLRVGREPLAELFDLLTDPDAAPVPVDVPTPPVPPAERPHRSTASGVGIVLRHELRRIAAQRGARWSAVVLALAPFLFALAMAAQDALPKDTLFGRQLHTAGTALPLVVLGFAASWVVPALGGLVAGDVFSVEDLNGTWPLLLTRSRSRAEVYIGKVLAAAVCAVVAVLILADASIIAGGISGHAGQLIGTTGQALSTPAAAGLAAEAWLSTLPAVLAYTAIGAALSVRTRKSWIGVGGPMLVGLVMLLLSQLDAGPLLRRVLLTPALLAWHGFTQSPATVTPFLVGLLTSVAWIAVALLFGWQGLAARRTTGGHRVSVAAVVTATAVAAAVVVGAVVGGGALSAPRVAAALSSSFDSRYALQQTAAGLGGIGGSTVQATSRCSRISGSTSGPGDDWQCIVVWLTPNRQPQSTLFDVTLRSDGCFTAAGPPATVGGPTLQLAGGKSVVNPLSEFDACLPLT